MLSQLIDLLCDVASGMLHIVSKGFVHTVNPLLSVPLLLHSMGQIIRSLASVCLSVCVCVCVCHRSYGRNFE